MPQIIREKLLSMAEEDYAQFNRKLIPNIDAAAIIGVRVPKLRTLAKSLSDNEIKAFLSELPHKLHEENMLHALIINNMKSPEAIFSALDAFLPFVDNWAVCDSLRPSALKKYPEELVFQLRRHISSEHTYTVRFAVEMLMVYFLDGYFDPEYPAMVATVKSDDYYVNMMLSWYFATALAKRWDEVICYLQLRRLSPWVHNKTIQKAIESYRISDWQKAYLKTLRI
ncbi:MAG: DNA alkylation repair protein [Oscillospiraceae bacterium]|nr:DNA alkylation repair protein [Oscillospiraceae bacterium]